MKGNSHFIRISTVFTLQILPQMEHVWKTFHYLCATLKSVSVASINIPIAKELINLHYGNSKLTRAISKVIYFCPLHFFNPTGEKRLLSLNCRNNQSYHKLSAPYTMFQLSLGGEKIISNPTENSSLSCKHVENTSLNVI